MTMTATPSKTKTETPISRSRIRLLAAIVEQPEEVVLALLLANAEAVED